MNYTAGTNELGVLDRELGRALEWHSRGQRFDPAYLHHLVLKTIGFQDFFFVKTVVLPLKCHFFELGRYTRLARYTLS